MPVRVAVALVTLFLIAVAVAPGFLAMLIAVAVSVAFLVALLIASHSLVALFRDYGGRVVDALKGTGK